MVSTDEYYIDEEAPIVHADHLPLQRIDPEDHSIEIIQSPELSTPCTTSRHDPGLEVLGFGLGPSRSGSSSSSHGLLELEPETMTVPVTLKTPCETLVQHANLDQGSIAASVPESSGSGSRIQLQTTAALAIQQSDTKPRSPSDTVELASRPAHRVDSAQESLDSVPQVSKQDATGGDERTSPLTMQTMGQPPAGADAQDSIAQSPTLRKHVIQVGESPVHTLPVVHAASSAADTAITSQRKESLPSFQQLADLADIASQQSTASEARPPIPARQHSHSISSITSQSPMIPYFPPAYPHSAQTSPAGFSTSARSPTGSVGEVLYGSPTLFAPPKYYLDRRSSNATVGTPGFPPPVPSLPLGSSTESHGTQASSSTDGYSTSHTTPIEPGPPPPDGIARILPPPPGMPLIPVGGFKCDYPGCNAIPFQTQYLLSSHRNVHSQNRPHYCPVRECPRSEGGKGFKRKNEMIRHGLVHNSPGYVCPFCPDREHRYPRPDNLQRHVRVHHVDKDRDDPALRAVLAQRSQGAVQKQRRRRTQGSEEDTPDARP